MSERSRSWTKGVIILVEDVIGIGHQTRTIGSDPCVFVAVAIDGVAQSRGN